MIENFEIIEWPKIQKFMDLEGFDDNSTLINPNDSLGIGSCTYLVDKEWLEELNEEKEE